MVETAASHKDQIHSNQALAKVLQEKGNEQYFFGYPWILSFWRGPMVF